MLWVDDGVTLFELLHVARPPAGRFRLRLSYARLTESSVTALGTGLPHGVVELVSSLSLSPEQTFQAHKEALLHHAT
jgi:hypothetical protein